MIMMMIMMMIMIMMSTSMGKSSRGSLTRRVGKLTLAPRPPSPCLLMLA